MVEQEFDPLPPAKAVFQKRFSSIGLVSESRGKYEWGVDLLAQSLIGIIVKRDVRIYCDVIYDPAVNAYVTKAGDLYLIGITDGVVSRVFDLIGRVVENAGLVPLRDPDPEYSSVAREVQFHLHFYAMAFVIGHECGHIELGHLDRALDQRQMVGEISETADTTYLQEAEADLLGVMSMIALKDPLYRLCELVGPTMAVALTQVPVAAVMSTFADAASSKVRKSGYPLPLVRLFRAGRFLLDFMPSVATYGEGLDPADETAPERFMSFILAQLSPEMVATLQKDPAPIGNAIREIQAATRPVVERWREDDSWLFFGIRPRPAGP